MFSKKGNIYFVDKPKGISSFDVIRRMRKKLNVRKMGHAGTLDPLASGLMILGVGKGTKELGKYLKLPKRYVVEMVVGESRTTGDMEGEIVEEKQVVDISKKELRRVLKEMEGVIELPVPLYSAIKVEGERLYKKARRGEEVETPRKEMRIDRMRLKKLWVEHERGYARLVMDVGSGAYVRSIVEEIGRRMGYPAVTKELRRVRIGKYKVWRARKV